MAENPVEKIVRDFQDRITSGTWDGIYGLPEPALEHVMECQADACVRAYAELYQIPAELDLDAFLERMELGGSAKIAIRREGDTIYFEELHSGQCVCPLVTREVISLKPELCRCAVHWLRKLFERHVRGPVHVELLDSAALGSQNCVFRIEIADTARPTA